MNPVAVLKAVLVRVAWLLVAMLIALGGAGIVAAMNHVPGTDARPELTWQTDRAAEAALDDATAQLQQVADEVDALGSTARMALAAVVAGDTDGVNAAVADGTLQLARVEAAVAALEAGVAAVPGTGDDRALRLSMEIGDRHDELAAAPSLAADLERDWTTFTGLALDAANLNGLLVRHDTETAAAAQQGAEGRYREALDLLGVADATIAETRAVRDRLSRFTDASTLTTWIDRHAAYDAALRALYETLLEAGGEVTDEVRAAFAAEQAARARLPADTRPLIIIMAEVAQGGLNQAVISIEEAREELAEALDVQRRLQEQVALPE